MAIHMFIYKEDGTDLADHPVSVTRVFLEYWKPAAEQLGLKMVPLLGALAFSDEYREEFLGELKVLGDWVAKQDHTDLQYDYIAERIAIITKLIETHGGEGVIYSFG